jgi:hypothetical protein
VRVSPCQLELTLDVNSETNTTARFCELPMSVRAIVCMRRVRVGYTDQVCHLPRRINLSRRLSHTWYMGRIEIHRRFYYKGTEMSPPRCVFIQSSSTYLPNNTASRICFVIILHYISTYFLTCSCVKGTLLHMYCTQQTNKILFAVTK